MAKIISLYQSKVIDLSWRAERGSTLLHRWHTRSGMSVAISACDRVSRQSNLTAAPTMPKCALCEILDEKRTKEISHANQPQP